MKSSSIRDPAEDGRELPREDEAAVKAATSWVQLFARTLKTCRLYDSNNPNVARFRTELDVALRRWIDDHGALVLTFTSDDVLYEGVSAYPARSREDNLALAFYRDGVRTLTFLPGIQPHETEALVDVVLQVTGQNPGEDDMVTLLWEANFDHIVVDYVPGDSDVGGEGSNSGERVPWPTATAEEDATAEDKDPGDAAVESEGNAQARGRSDDWTVGAATAEIEAEFDALEALAPSELERFRNTFEAENERSAVTSGVAIARAYLSAGIGAHDRLDLARFLPRVLRQAWVEGSWREACETLEMLSQCGSTEWSIQAFGQELLQPISIANVKQRLEKQDLEAVGEFVAFARWLDEQAVDLLNLVLAETQNVRHQRQIADEIVELCRSNPERLAPWLADPRPGVVRNVVQMLGAIGGSSIIGLLQSVHRHPDPRVRLEVVTALRGVEPRIAQPLLVGMLEGADSRMFCAVLQLLSHARDKNVSQIVLAHLTKPDFEKRPAEEKRAIYSALAASGGDEILPQLEAELHKGNWFSRGQEPHKQSVARCIARIGTGLARTILERGAASRRVAVRKACEDALARVSDRD